MRKRRPAPQRPVPGLGTPGGVPNDPGPFLCDRQVGERLGLRPREVRRIFCRIAVPFGLKLRRYGWLDVLREIERLRRPSGRSA